MATAAWPIKVGSNNYYQVTICSPAGGGVAACNDTNPPPAPSFQVVAIPVAGSGQDKDSACQVFGVDSTGRQWANDSNGNPNTQICWSN